MWVSLFLGISISLLLLRQGIVIKKSFTDDAASEMQIRSIGRALVLKRILDVVVSFLGILLSLPLWALIAVLIYLHDRGPVFIIQERVGLKGRIFRAFKFRSMRRGEEKLPHVQAGEADPRVTPVGRLLRATAMDELPQLINILIGDMSFVGPRALLASEIEVHETGEEDDYVGQLFEKRCQVVPGLTGIAQIFAPRDIPRRKKFRYDLLYVRKQNFLLDVKLIFLSFWITFTAKWESRTNKFELSKKKIHV
jgi:lipopolysaccharide/colanic/teichoic acid biosynthesis glycosyltransferase